MIQIICGFPGVGKTYLANREGRPGRVIDSDSASFPKDETWPRAYVEHLIDLRDQNPPDTMILCSTHEEVLDGLDSKRVPYILAYPVREAKEIYLERYRDRGSQEATIRAILDNWDAWIGALMLRVGCPHMILTPGQGLGDVALRFWPEEGA